MRKPPRRFALFDFFGLTGHDGRPSFAKLVIVSVIASYYANSPVPAAVAAIVIAAAYGRPMLSELLSRSSVNLSSAVTESLSRVVGGVKAVVTKETKTETSAPDVNPPDQKAGDGP